ncbi:BTAD domain-containing putative transcriptional regulator [Allostreptomyces psammosilenae]|uniref:Putative ATPase/DNA-binding SARP family transcriptional activator n=1 Tax=Allostreptomyces psammosilenae TaxID=1892865 RepID=A0A852ZUU4_9ACTN|nr:BTAD domain-containing putative transcriptional regulator [Allostreptomyces psammosilenae]NYI04544.1 putative ATPase/DNA-binding SARP family transcriptional activator [Allostreptomyces psammosilenae]
MTHRYRVLGTTQALRPDGTEVPLSGARLRALLTALAAGGGRAVPVRDLVAQVWGERDTPPADEVGALQALVGRLRRALGGGAVASVPGGYRLAVEPDAIDLFRFERLCARGADALRAGDPATAAELLHDALALWSGPALADLPGRDTDPLAARAERRRARARADRLAAEVALGRSDGALLELAALAAEEPLDEPLQALWIRALWASGRRAEALRRYEEVRLRLADRLGTDPGRELRALHAELLSADTAPAPAAARPPVTPATGPTALPGNLRARLTSFVGRETDLTALTDRLRTGRLVTLLGPGGVGKTRLALEAAQAAAAHGGWPDGVWIAELAPVGEEHAVPEAVLTALGARTTVVRPPSAAGELRAAEAARRDPLTELVEHCGQRRMLLVLDNCEHVVGTAAELAETVLAGCPGVTVLATSREPLAVPGESVWPVEPLPTPAALRLLAERGAAARPGFHTEQDPPACAEICRRLDGLPLAIELAAARLRALTPRQIADRLDDRFRLLAGGSRANRTALPRQRTLWAVVDWSWDLLDERERATLRRLAVFSGGCELAEAEAVCGPDALEALTGLVDKSLVVADPGGPRGMRYRLLETVAEYAARRLDEAGERQAAARRHLEVYRELARTGDPELRGPRQAEWLDRFTTEHDNLRAALRTAVALREEQEALCLVLSLSWFWQLREHQADVRGWVTTVARLGPDPFLPEPRPAVPLRDPCTTTPPPWPEEHLWEARRGLRLLALASNEGDGTALGTPRTRAHLEAIVAAYRPGMPQTCRPPGFMWFIAQLMTGRFDQLGEALDAMVRGCRELGHDWELGFALLMRAKMLGDRPDGLEQATTDADQALARFERAGDQWGIAEALSARGEALHRRGHHARAAADYERAIDSARRIGADSQVPVFRARLASVRLETAPDAAAREHAERLLLEAVDEADRFPGEAVSMERLLLAQRYGTTGRTDRAREQLRRMEQTFTTATPTLFTGMVAGLHGWLDCLDGEYPRALRHLRQAVRRLDPLGYLVAPQVVAVQFLSAAWAKAHLGAAPDGARLLGAYDRGGAATGLAFRALPDEAGTRARAEAELRAVLRPDTYQHAYAEGGGLAVRQAAALV